MLFCLYDRVPNPAVYQVIFVGACIEMRVLQDDIQGNRKDALRHVEMLHWGTILLMDLFNLPYGGGGEIQIFQWANFHPALLLAIDLSGLCVLIF